MGIQRGIEKAGIMEWWNNGDMTIRFPGKMVWKLFVKGLFLPSLPIFQHSIIPVFVHTNAQ
jgi:hypothetical protein